MSNKIEDYIPKSDNAPKWSIGFSHMLTAIVGAILASTPMVESFMGKKDDVRKIAGLEGQVKGLSGSMDSLLEGQGELRERVNNLMEERNNLEKEIGILRQKLELEVKLREKLEIELQRKERRIKELELLLAKLTDGKINSFGK